MTARRHGVERCTRCSARAERQRWLDALLAYGLERNWTIRDLAIFSVVTGIDVGIRLRPRRSAA